MDKERAAVVLRVSSTGRRQQTANQDAPVYGLVTSKGYVVAREFRIRTSAWHGEQQPVLDEVLAGVTGGNFTVVAVAALDRLERRGVFALTDWLRAVMRSGGRIESARRGEEWLADTRDEAMWMHRLIWEADRARRESEIRSERIRESHARKEREGQGWYALPLGWVYETRSKFDSVIVADLPAQAAVQAGIRTVAAGGTLQSMSRVMADAGYRRTSQQCETIVRNLGYSIGVLMVPGEIEVNHVVSPDVQGQAIAVLDDRIRYRQGRNRQVDADDFAGRIFCRMHRRPLHRNYGPRHKDGSRTRYYSAKMPDGRSCGCGLFNADELDKYTEVLMSIQGQPEYAITVVGTDPAEQVRVEAAIIRLARKRPEGWLDTMAELDGRLVALRAGRMMRERRPTGHDLGDIWVAMDRRGKRRYLERQAEAGNFRVVFWKRPGKIVTGVLMTPEGMIAPGCSSTVEEFDSHTVEPVKALRARTGPRACGRRSAGRPPPCAAAWRCWPSTWPSLPAGNPLSWSDAPGQQ